jgi:Raf kinase inhibitor-like YbhB/YbcL family protein
MQYDRSDRAPYAARACLGIIVMIVGLLGAANVLADDHFGDSFRVSSSTFANKGVLPISMIYNSETNGVNGCSINGAVGLNQSPELSWKHAPWGTRSFAVTMFDVTASFTHWGMYNIPAGTDMLPAGAGAAGSTYGAQVLNDFADQSYDGPCPPIGVQPYSHQYVVTMYALDKDLRLPAFANFPDYAEALWYALAKAAADGHVLATASIEGFYSATPAP